MTARALERTSRIRAQVDWPQIDLERAVHTVLVSRALDELEESRLLPERKVLYQFTARGHDVTQVLLGQMLTGARDGVGVYYRSRPLMLALGLTLDDALASTMMRSGSVSEGRDIGVVFNLPRREGPCVLPACGGVGAQYTPVVGWAQSLRYRAQVLRDERVAGSIAVAHGGEASIATNGFWSALTIATTQRLPILFFIEDNGYGISVKSDFQTPGGNIAANLAAFRNLKILEGDSADPRAAAATDRQRRRGSSRRRRAGAAAPARAAPVRSFRPGHADLQVRGRDRRGARARSARAAARAAGAGDDQRRGVACARNARARRRATRARQRRAASAARRRERHALCVQRGARRRHDRRAAAGRPAERRHRAARRHARPCMPRVRASTCSRRSAARSSTSSRSIRASSSSARTSAARAACTRRRWDCRRSSAPRACSTPACPRRASSAARSAWRSPA